MRFHLSSLCLLLILGPLSAQEPKTVDLPVTRVVLFSSGVGYFEHKGSVDGDSRVSLTFKTSEMNDVLKSLVLRDSAEGSSVVVNYPSQDPLAHTLESFAINLSGTGGLQSLLPQLRGVEMTVSIPDAVTGRLVGYEEQQRPGANGKGEVQNELMLTLATETGLRSFPLSSVTQLQLMDPSLNQELSKALDWLAKEKDDRRKTVQIDFFGKGRRDISLGYVSEAPVWKTSYRLDLSGGKPFLQVWAIVENTSEEDWNRVTLSLVSGRPVSFIQDLYSPLYVSRPIVAPSLETAPVPQPSEEGLVAPEASESRMAAKSMDLAPSPEGVHLRESAPTPVATWKAGELFEFNLKNPVTLARQRSALLPLVQSEIQAEKVSVYNAAVLLGNPMNAAWITNTTGSNLPAGPITIFDGGIYAGDALTTTLVPNDRRLWTYAVDGTVAVDPSSSSERKTTKILIVNGVLNKQEEILFTQIYRIQNKASVNKVVVVEHPFISDRTLVAPAKYEEKTPSVYRFRVEVGAGKTFDFQVVEKQSIVQTQAVLAYRTQDLFALVSSNQPLSGSVKTALQKAADLKNKADRLGQDLDALAAQKADEEEGESRLRDNISAAGRDSPQGQVYLKKLGDSEKRIESLGAQTAEKRQAQRNAQKELEDYLRGLSVD